MQRGGVGVWLFVSVSSIRSSFQRSNLMSKPKYVVCRLRQCNKVINLLKPGKSYSQGSITQIFSFIYLFFSDLHRAGSPKISSRGGCTSQSGNNICQLLLKGQPQAQQYYIKCNLVFSVFGRSFDSLHPVNLPHFKWSGLSAVGARYDHWQAGYFQASAVYYHSNKSSRMNSYSHQIFCAKRSRLFVHVNCQFCCGFFFCLFVGFFLINSSQMDSWLCEGQA